jgi:NADPH:quinone reductase-like Zn-dependent oxidoreductase
MKPASLDHNEAAAIPMAGLTAWQALFLHGGLKRGQTVLIHWAAGGVGSFAVQHTHAAGAYVIGTGRAGAAELVAELGADEFFNVDQQHLGQVVREADLVLDLRGGAPGRSFNDSTRDGQSVFWNGRRQPPLWGEHDLRYDPLTDAVLH